MHERGGTPKTGRVCPPRVEQLPDPDTICETEYLKVWEALMTATADLPEHERDEHALAVLDRLRDWAGVVEGWLRTGDVTGRHLFEDATDMCVGCGATLDDDGLGVGCEAGPDGNPAWYLGLALTPAEQAAGVSIEDKYTAVTELRRQELNPDAHSAG